MLIGTARHVRESVAARNADPSPTRFLVDPEDHFAALRRARALGADLVGVYHSHPGTDAIPSATDIDGAEADSHMLWLIVSLRSPSPSVDARLFRPAQGNFDAVEFVVVG